MRFESFPTETGLRFSYNGIVFLVIVTLRHTRM